MVEKWPNIPISYIISGYYYSNMNSANYIFVITRKYNYTGITFAMKQTLYFYPSNVLKSQPTNATQLQLVPTLQVTTTVIADKGIMEPFP